jgi:hypothetical protein
MSKQIAYSMASIGELDVNSKCAFLQDTPVMRSNFKCTGVKYCEFLDPEILHLHHDEDPSNALAIIQQRRNRNSYADARVRANAFITDIQRAFQNGVSCKQVQRDDCRAIMLAEAREVYVLNRSLTCP